MHDRCSILLWFVAQGEFDKCMMFQHKHRRTAPNLWGMFLAPLNHYANKSTETTNKTRLLALHASCSSSSSSSFARYQHTAHCYCTGRQPWMHATTQTEFPAIQALIHPSKTKRFRGVGDGLGAPRAFSQFLLNTIKTRPMQHSRDDAVKGFRWATTAALQLPAVAASVMRPCAPHVRRSDIQMEAFVLFTMCNWHVQSHLKPVLRRPDAQVLGPQGRVRHLRNVTEWPSIQCVGHLLDKSKAYISIVNLMQLRSVSVWRSWCLEQICSSTHHLE